MGAILTSRTIYVRQAEGKSEPPRDPRREPERLIEKPKSLLWSEMLPRLLQADKAFALNRLDVTPGQNPAEDALT